RPSYRPYLRSNYTRVSLTYYFLLLHGDHKDLHSFPTRRSSDLLADEGMIREAAQALLEARRDGGRVLYQLALLDDLQVLETHRRDRKSTRLNSSHVKISYAVFCLKKKK